MMLTLNKISENKKIAIDIARTVFIEEYCTGSKIRIILDERNTKDVWVKETPEQICEMANALNKK